MMACEEKSGAGALAAVLDGRMSEMGVEFSPEIPDGDTLVGTKFSLCGNPCGWSMNFEVGTSDGANGDLHLLVDGFSWLPDADTEALLTDKIVPSVRKVGEIAATFGLTELIVPGMIAGVTGMSKFPELLGCLRRNGENGSVEDTIFFQSRNYVMKLANSS
ncbi:hypothetical protein JW710_03565 [Candidatus Dojkabacteria bacterium]|nr:hypothetical protein [Candidatus Dojkabacteria bacterium]